MELNKKESSWVVSDSFNKYLLNMTFQAFSGGANKSETNKLKQLANWLGVGREAEFRAVRSMLGT